MRARALGGFAAIAVLGACAAACSNDFDTTRTPPPRGTVGEELFGVLCDRVGAQALHEDLTGDSFHAICHKDTTGAYADHVDTTKLPPSEEGAIDRDNNPVTVAVQDANRAHAVARVEALARRRGDLIAALDATFPDVTVPVKDIKNSDETQSCNAPGAGQSGERKLSDELADLLGRFQDLYNDGTIPQSTESLARVFDAIKASPEAQQSLARFEARQGYRPLQVGLGAARPIVAYPNLRDLSNTALALLSSDSDPYKKDANGNHVFVAGVANPQFQKLIDVAHNEMLYATPDPAPKLLNDHVVDPSVSGRPLLSRTRTNLEFLQQIFYAQNDAFGGGNPHVIVKRDDNGYAQVRLVNGKVPLPFVDSNPPDGIADVYGDGRFYTADGKPPVPPFFAPGLPFSNTRDTCGRLIGGPAGGGSGGGGGTGDAGDASVTSDAGAVDSGSGGTGTQTITEKLCGANDDTLQYEYIDTAHVFAGSLLNDLKPLLNPDVSQQHETLMYALAGAQVLFGKRDGSDLSQRCYATDPKNPATCLDAASILKYDAYHPETSPLVDLIYALGQVMADPTTDDTLAFVKLLFEQHLGDVARLAGDGLKMKANANADTKAKIPANSVFWDDMLDVTVSIEQEPGLLEDVLRALGKPGSEQLGTIFANYMSFDDRITYDRTNLNGKAYNATTKSVADMTTPVDRTQPDKGYSRSAMQRFLQAIHDTNGVTACNKDGAVVHAKGIPIVGSLDLPIGGGSYKECEVFKIENLATFYLDSIVGKASIYFRPDVLRNGVLGIGAATVGVIEQSSGIGLNANDTTGFWDTTDSKTFRPRPQWLNRLVFFDQTNDNTAPTHDFLRDLQGTQIGTSICPERVITDPAPTAPDASADGKVHGLRSCHDGDWLIQRDADTMFVWEQFGFYPAMTPLLTAFVNHKKEDLFIALMEVLYKHWGSANADPNECAAMTDQAGTITKPFCVGDGIVSYEPLLAQQFNGDFIPGLHDLEATLEASSIPHCTAINDDPNDKTKHVCTTSSAVDGITVLANATRALLDPVKAKDAGLVDRKGNPATVKNDGTAIPQTTPIYLVLNALNAMDASFDAYPEKDRLTQWRTARSQLVDQFLAVNGTDKSSTFANVSIPHIVPTIIDATRAQLFAYCPTTFQAPFDKCVWARETMTKEMSDVMSGPTFAASLDVIDAIRKDDNARKQMGLLIQYLLDAASKNDALPAVLASANDMIQLLKDDTNLVPLYHVLAQALAKSQPDAQGNITQRSVVDAQLTLLGRISGRATDTTGKEICARELDPNQVLTVALGRLVTPMVGADGQDALTPLQVIMDVIGDVNREGPERTDKFEPQDYASIADNVSDFMLNKERGLEQFYEIVRQGTEK